MQSNNIRLPHEVSETWDRYVGSQTPQEFMNLSRQGNPDITYQEAAHEYAQHINEMFGDASDYETDEQLQRIEYQLAWYLEATQGEEWN